MLFGPGPTAIWLRLEAYALYVTYWRKTRNGNYCMTIFRHRIRLFKAKDHAVDTKMLERDDTTAAKAISK